MQQSLTTAQVSRLAQDAIQEAHARGFQSYKVTTELDKQVDGYSLSPFRIHGGIQIKNATFKIPDVFAPIIANPEQAKAKGTIFFPVLNDVTHLCIQDLYAVAPTHVLIIPKDDAQALPDLAQDSLGELYAQAIFVALETLKLTQATLTVNVYPPNQEVPHVHLHLISQEKHSFSPAVSNE